MAFRPDSRETAKAAELARFLLLPAQLWLVAGRPPTTHPRCPARGTT